MSTATAEPQADPALLPHTFDPATGKCYEPEIVTITVPKGCACVLRLAQSETGAWFHGYRLEAGEADVLDTFPADSTPPHATRAAALRAAASEAEQWFAASPKSKLHRKCAGLVTAFLIAQEGSPANSRPARAAAAIPEPRTAEVEVEGVTPNPHNPRGAISPESVAELAAAIEAVGLLQPVGIRLIPDDSGLPGVGAVRRELLWGHRRLAAFQKLKRATIPARVYEGISDDQARLLLLIENGQRKDLDPIQEARGYADMMRDFELTQDDIAKAVKKSRPVVANALRLLELPADVQEMLADGRLTTAHGTALCRFKAWPAVCSRIAALAIADQASASTLEKNLPFAEQLAEEDLAVDLCSYNQEYACDFKAIKKQFSKEPSFFIWEDKEAYEDFAYTLDIGVGGRLLADEQEKAQKQQSAREAERSGRDEETGELTPAAKRERQKKLDENLTNRLQVSTLQHLAVQRLKDAGEEIDKSALLVVLVEALRHAPDVADLAKEFDVKLPKGFDEYYDDEDGKKLAAMLSMTLPDLVRLAAAALSNRDSEQAMRFAGEVPGYTAMLVREDPRCAVDAESHVAEWEEKILPLVKYGARAEDVVERLGCPVFVAEQLVRQIRRNIRNAGVPLLSKEDGEAMDKVTRAELAKIKQRRLQMMTALAIGQELRIDTATIQSVIRCLDFEKAYAKAMNIEEAEEKPAAKPKPKAAKKPAKKAGKGGKKK
jgi:ParB/RepB/Spo0J family partition protein